MIRFNKHYFGLAVIILLVEVLIALYVHDDFIRPYLGDVLVVIGTSFSWVDLIMYAVGVGAIVIIEKYWFRKPLRISPG